MIFFCNEEFTACVGYDTDKFEDFAKILKVVDEATSDEDIMDYLEKIGVYYNFVFYSIES